MCIRDRYTRLEYHELTGMTYTIINKAFKSEEIYQYNDDGTYAVRDRFRKEVPLSEVDEWAGLSEEPVIIGNIDKPLFAYIKVPKANKDVYKRQVQHRGNWQSDGCFHQ